MSTLRIEAGAGQTIWAFAAECAQHARAHRVVGVFNEIETTLDRGETREAYLTRHDAAQRAREERYRQEQVVNRSTARRALAETIVATVLDCEEPGGAIDTDDAVRKVEALLEGAT